MKDLSHFFKSMPKRLLLWFSLAVLAILALPAIFIRPGFRFLDFSDTGEIGDTIGGIMGPFVAILAAFLTFVAFWAQFVANNELIKENRRNHFENRFYKLLDIHLESVANLNSRFDKDKNSSSYSCFRSWCEEISNVYALLHFEADMGGFLDESIEINKRNPSSKDYVVFLINLRESREKRDELFFEMTYSYFFEGNFSMVECGDPIQTKHAIQFSREFSTYLAIKKQIKMVDTARNEILGRYYRHLFQIVQYVVELPDDLYDGKDWKTDVLSILRSQMSDYEQLMLYYNAQFSLGKAWNERHYIEDYKLVKNIPSIYIFACPGVAPSKRYQNAIKNAESKGEKFFERG